MSVEILNRLTIKSRLFVIFVLLASFMVGIGLTGLYNLHASNIKFKSVFDNRLMCMAQLADIMRETHAEREYLNAAMTDGVRDPAELLDKINIRERIIASDWKDFISTSLTLDEQVIAERFRKDSQIYREQALMQTVSALQHHQLEQARAIYQGPMRTLFAAVSADVNELMKIQIEVGKQKYEQSETLYADFRTNVVIVILLGLAGSGGLYFFLARSISNRLSQAVSVANAIAAGELEQDIASEARDEIGQLNRAMQHMSRSLTQSRAQNQLQTQQLQETHQKMAASHKQIDDSINYASLLQRAMLPVREMTDRLGESCAHIWLPRDTVGGDFFVFQAGADDFLLGVIDCAGHGVPGAMMTMMVGTEIDHAVSQLGIDNPAAILESTDRAMRAMLAGAAGNAQLATNADAGIFYVSPAQRLLRFSGAKISLFVCDGQQVEEIRSGRRALGHKRQDRFVNTEMRLQSGRTYTLVSDGFLDQSGGADGYCFGKQRFAALLLECADLPMKQHAAAFAFALETYRAGRAQRDDVTVLTFRYT
jgi:serine phosphatase RsbU (regulator of sigma subunit)/CHASE3 domain sensor protein